MKNIRTLFQQEQEKSKRLTQEKSKTNQPDKSIEDFLVSIANL